MCCYVFAIFFDLRVTCIALSGIMSSECTYWYRVFSIRSWGS